MNLLENKTKKQHYIPQVYLRGFSPQYKNGKGKPHKDKYRIYAYDLRKTSQVKRFQLNLYAMKIIYMK